MHVILLLLVYMALHSCAAAFDMVFAPDAMQMQSGAGAALAMPQPLLGLGAAAAVSVAYDRRPRGWVRTEPLDVRPSNIPGAGLGLFAARHIERGECLGSYPGWLQSQAHFVQNKGQLGDAIIYVWSLRNGLCLDPTDEQGYLRDSVSWLGLGLGAISTALARINEPSQPFEVNVITKEQADEVLFYSKRKLYKGDELFCDYGPVYNRAHYTRQ